jgi:paraquat-inducible protein A
VHRHDRDDEKWEKVEKLYYNPSELYVQKGLRICEFRRGTLCRHTVPAFLRSDQSSKNQPRLLLMQEIPDVMACEICDAIHTRPSLGPGEIARCTRCGAELERDMRAHRKRILPLSIASLIMYVVANVYPIMEIELHGLSNQTTLFGTVLSMNAAGMLLIAFLVFATTIAFPLVNLFALFYLLICINRLASPLWFNLLVRMIQTLRPWIMVEILLLGAIVSFVKMTSMAAVVPGVSLWALGGLALLVASVLSFDPKCMWDMSLLNNNGDKAVPTNRTGTGRSIGTTAEDELS